MLSCRRASYASAYTVPVNTHAHAAGAETESVRAKFGPAWCRRIGLNLSPAGPSKLPLNLYTKPTRAPRSPTSSRSTYVLTSWVYGCLMFGSTEIVPARAVSVSAPSSPTWYRPSLATHVRHAGLLSAQS